MFHFRRLLPLACLLVLATSAAACNVEVSLGNTETIEGSGTLATETFDLSGFDSIQVSNAFVVTVAAAPDFGVGVTVDDNLLDHLEVEVRGSTLVVQLKPDIGANDATLEATIAMPALLGVSAAGASGVSFTGFGPVDRFEIEASGASRIAGDLNATLLVAELSGATRLELRGTSTEARLEASGASAFDLTDLEIARAEVRLSGASDANLVVTEELGPVALNGASELEFGGGAALRDVESSGGSRLSER